MNSYFQMLRIKHWLGFFLISTLGFLISKGFLHSFQEIFIFYLMVFLYLGFGFSINNCFDIKEDELSGKKNPIVLKELSFKKGLIFSLSLAFFGIVLSLFFKFQVFLLYFIMVLMAFSYSAPPLRFKSRFLLDLISHGLFAGSFLFLLPLIIFAPELTWFHYTIIFSIFYFSMISELRNHIEDYENDKKANLKTTVCVLGLKKSKKLVNLLIILFPPFLLPLFFQKNFLYFLIITMLFYLIFSIKKNYRILDVYTNISYGLVLMGILI